MALLEMRKLEETDTTDRRPELALLSCAFLVAPDLSLFAVQFSLRDK